MPLFKIAQGPWTLLFQGKIKENDLEIYVNPQKMLFLQTFHPNNGKIDHVTCVFYHPLLATGDVSGFIQTLPRETVTLTKHSASGETHSYLVLGTDPVSMTWEEDIVLEQTDILLKKMEVTLSLIADVAKAYDITLQKMADLPPALSDAFFSQPLLFPTLSTNAHFTASQETASNSHQSASAHMGALPGEFILGVTSAGLVVKEPVAFFKKTTIFNGRFEHRKHALQVIGEGALFSNIPLVIFDWENEFSVMRNPNPDPAGLHDQKIEGDPIGFPLKEFSSPENIKLDLSLLPPEGLVETLGLSHHELGEHLSRFLHEHHVTTLDEARSILKQLPPTPTLTGFHIAGLIRLLTLLDQTFPSYFTGSNPIDEISKSWFQAIGRVGIIRMKTIPAKLKPLIVCTVLKGIYQSYEQKGISGHVKSMVIIPEIQQLFENSQPALESVLLKLFSLSNSQDVGFLFSSPHEIDLPKELLSILEARVNIISGKEAAITLEGRKNYRVNVRDTYSQSPFPMK